MSLSPQHPLDFIPQVAAERAKILASEAANPQRRLLLIGVSGSGKTYSTVTTCPNPVVDDFDNQLDHPAVVAALRGVFPMWDKAWIKNELKPTQNIIDEIVMQVIEKYVAPLPPDCTFIVDAISTLADLIRDSLTVRAPKGDSYWFWREWSNFWRRFITALKNVRCNVVVIAHETQVRDSETGRVLNYGWLLQGQEFSPRLPQFFTDVVRQVRETTVDPTSGKVTSKYLWQIAHSKEFDVAKTRCSAKTQYIPADWRELTK
jgi:hypothetical protein